MATPTELFINSELPKRPYTNQFPLTAGHVPVATGTGLQVEARALTTSDISGMNSYATQEDLSNVLAGLWDDRGAYTVNAAGNINYPSSAGSGVAGALMKGDIFTVAGAVAGVSTINNIAVNNGDTVRALVDNPSATDNAHWAIAENNIGYVPENTANKTTNTDLSGAAGTYPDTPTVKSYIDKYDISAASINSTGTVTLTRTASNLTFQVPTAISGLSFDANTGVLTSSYTNNATSTTITVAANEVSDNVFRIKDNTDATKKIAFEATNVGSGTTKTIIMPNSDIDLGQMPIIVNITSNTTYSVSVANGTRDHIILTTSDFTLNAQQLTTSGSVIVRSKDGNPYTVTRSGSQAWNFVGLSTNPITVSAGNDFYLGGNVGSGNHTCYMTGSFAASSFAIRKDHTSNSPYFTFTAPNLTNIKTITMPNRDIDLDGIPFVNNASGSLGIVSNQVNYLLSKAGDFTFSLPITYASTGTSTIFVLKNNSISQMPIMVNLTWSGQSGGFTLSPQVGHSDQSTTTAFLEYGPFTPLVISGASGNKLFQIGTLAASGSAIIGIYANGAGSFRLQVTYIDGQKLGANNTNLKICKNLSNEYIATTINASNLTGANTLTLANKDVDLGTISSVAATDGNTLSGTRTRILGGSGNTIDGTGNIAIGSSSINTSGKTVTLCTFINSSYIIPPSYAMTKTTMIGVRNVYMTTKPLAGSLFLGSSDNNDVFRSPVAAVTVLNSLFGVTDAFPVSGTLYATTDGVQTLSSSNCLPIPAQGGTTQYEIDFIVSVGLYGFSAVAATGCIVMRRIFSVFYSSTTGTVSLSAVDTVGTDRTLGTISGTFTPDIALSGTTHVTVGITRAGGVAGQEGMAISARVRSHITK